MDEISPPSLRMATTRLTIAIFGGALLGGSLAGLLGMIATNSGVQVSIPRVSIWMAIGAVFGAIQAGSHVGLQLHREWCEATIPHDHDH